jgi:streptogramin lyase
LAFVVGVNVAAAAVPENSAPEGAVPAATVVEQAATTLASEPSQAEAEAFFDRLAGNQPTELASCPFGTCNRNLDCFQQQYTCDFGTAKWCFGGPTTGCQGECGCF